MSVFSTAEESIKQDISKRKALQDELSSAVSTPEAKALGEEFNRIRDEMTKLKSENDEAFAKRGELKTQREELQKERDKAFEHRKAVQNEYFKQRDAYRTWTELTRKVTPFKKFKELIYVGRHRVRDIGNNGRKRNVDELNIMLLFDLKKLLEMPLQMKSGSAKTYPNPIILVDYLVASIVRWT